jgi:N-acetylmuramoyl-L-alanine amidase
VIIDPGHGGHDRGAAIGYVYEKHLALDTARRVAQLLGSAGLRVVMTRDRDVFIPLDGRSAMGNSRPGAVFVSIHYNYNRSGSGHGIETYHCHEGSYQLAAYIQAYVIKESGLQNRGVKRANFHVIRRTTKNPAVLVECGFVSNRAERGAMVTGNYREGIAEGIAKGIIAYRRK